MPTFRERASDALLDAGIRNSIDREEVTRGIETAPRTQGYDAACGAMACAAWVDSTMLWLSWRLRPRIVTGS